MRRAKRCVHGFVTWIPCRACILLDLALARAIKEREAREATARLATSAPRCAVCRSRGHISKLCPATVAGRRRLVRRQNPGLVVIEAMHERIARAG